VDRTAQRKIDHSDVVQRLQRNGLPDGRNHSAIGARAVLIEDTKIDNVGLRRDAFKGSRILGTDRTGTVAGDQARDVGAVAILIVGAVVPGTKLWFHT